MKRFVFLILMISVLLCFSACVDKPPKSGQADYKPVIYLYPEETTEVSVEIDYNGKLTCTYPEYNNGWKVIAEPDGTIVDIKVLANYSFVQLYANDAQTAIDKLNGYDYRGRKLAVSFSRQKSDDDLADDSDVNEIAEDQYSEEDVEMSAEDAAAYAAAEKAASDKEPFGLN